MYQTSSVNNTSQTEILQKGPTLWGLRMKKQTENDDATLSSAPYLLKFCVSSGTGMALQ